MIKTLAFCLLIFFGLIISFNSNAQIKISEANIQFILPDAFQKILPKKDLGNGRCAYTYKRNSIINKDGVNVIPNIGIITETVPKDIDLIEYTAKKRIDVPFQVLDVFANDAKGSNLTCENSIGYKGYYNGRTTKHIIYVIHLINNNCGVQIIMDATEDVIIDCEGEFIEVMKSLKKY